MNAAMLVAEESDQNLTPPGVLVAAMGTGRPSQRLQNTRPALVGAKGLSKVAFLLKTLEEEAALPTLLVAKSETVKNCTAKGSKCEFSSL